MLIGREVLDRIFSKKGYYNRRLNSSSGILTVPPYADADAGCFQGTYFVRESSGTQGLWTFSQDGTYQSASSAEAARSFGHAQGAWKKTRDRELRSTGLAFTFSDGHGDVGVPPLRTARVDARYVIHK